MHDLDLSKVIVSSSVRVPYTWLPKKCDEFE